MTKYFVVCFKPFDKGVSIKEAKDLEDAIAIAHKKRRSGGSDVVIVKKGEDGKYSLERYGYYKVYDWLNKILLFFVIMLILFISYLYFKYLKK
jgi:hypothetical protein